MPENTIPTTPTGHLLFIPFLFLRVSDNYDLVIE